MVLSNTRSGRLHKYSGGWESAFTRIYLNNETLVEWRRLSSEQEFGSDNAVASFLLERNQLLTLLLTYMMDLQLQETQATMINRLVEIVSMYFAIRCKSRDAME